MINRLLNNYRFSIFLAVTFYSSLVIGFFLGENLNAGAIGDWHGTNYPVIRDSAVDLKDTLLNYESYHHRHSPVYPIFLGQFLKLNLSYDFIRFIHLNISLSLVYVFYKCLALKFREVNKNILIILSLIIFLSPTFRSLAIWPDSRIIGVIFFTLSIFEFLKFQKNNSYSHVWKNLLYLIISSYISPNFSIFIIFFAYHYLKKLNFTKLIFISFFCLIMASPAFYYLFILDINFLLAKTPGINENETIGLSFNFADKILIISSIIMFQLTPFLLNKKFIIELFEYSKKNILVIIPVFLLSVIFFDYSVSFTGGGVFFQISNLILNNNLIFYILALLSLFLLGYFSNKNLNNFLIFFVLICSNVQNSIYHKYYDPLIVILFFTIFSNFLNQDFFKKNINLFYLYCFYFVFISLRIIKNVVF